MKHYSVAVFVLLAISLSGCSNARNVKVNSAIPHTSASSIPAEPIPVDAQVVSGSNRFGVSMLRDLAHKDEQGNVFISPMSVSYALAMVYNGAGGATKSEMAKVLGFEGMELDRVDQGFDSLSRSLHAADPKVELSIANSLWGKQDVRFEEDFMDRGRRFFDAEISDLSGGTEAINDWTSRKTKGKIPEILKPGSLNPNTVLVLVNAIYFNGTWTNEFEKSDTKDQDFHGLGGTYKAPTMFQRLQTTYRRDADFQVARLPYGSGRLAMYVVLPREGLSPLQLCDRIGDSKWNDLFGGLELVDLSLYIPKFRIEWGDSLVETLRSLGIRQAFAPSSDFLGISSTERPYFDVVIHKTFVDVNEEGTEAAAATAIGMMPAGAGMPKPREEVMRVDRPFLCMIVDDYSKAILFAGIINHP